MYRHPERSGPCVASKQRLSAHRRCDWILVAPPWASHVDLAILTGALRLSDDPPGTVFTRHGRVPHRTGMPKYDGGTRAEGIDMTHVTPGESILLPTLRARAWRGGVWLGGSGTTAMRIGQILKGAVQTAKCPSSKPVCAWFRCPQSTRLVIAQFRWRVVILSTRIIDCFCYNESVARMLSRPGSRPLQWWRAYNGSTRK